jgi:hypothetical protein
MIFKRCLGLLFLGMLTVGSVAAEVIIRVRPPRVVVEQREARPSRQHVWVSGYQRWDGNAYAWQRGRWEQPPHARGRWVPHHYVRRGGGYVFVEGHWR